MSRRLKICKVAYFFTKRFRDLLHICESNVFLGSFNHADIGSVYFCKLTKAFLGDTSLGSLFMNSFAEVYENLFICSHVKSVATC